MPAIETLARSGRSGRVQGKFRPEDDTGENTPSVSPTRDVRLAGPQPLTGRRHSVFAACPAAARRQWAALPFGDRCSTPASTAARRPVLHDAAPIAPATMTGTAAPPPSNATVRATSDDIARRETVSFASSGCLGARG